MRWIALGLLFASSVAGCTCAASRPPPPTPGLQKALSRVEAALDGGRHTQVQAELERVAVELEAWSNGGPERTKTAARQLAAELRDFADNGVLLTNVREEWSALRARLVAAMEGRDPGPPPRFRRDLPRELLEAIHAAEARFALHDLQQACSDIDQVTMLLSEWRWSNPPRRHPERVRAATEQLDAMPAHCRSVSLDTAREEFNRALAQLAPDFVISAAAR